MKAIVIDSEIHLVKPDSHEDVSRNTKETFCGVSFTEDNVEESSEGLFYIDQILETLRTRANVELECEDCVSNSKDWAA